MTEFYEHRYISKNDSDSRSLFFLEDSDRITLKNTVFEHDKIVLLGSPGIGKTTELKNLFNELWKEKDQNGLIPFYINLKYFRKTSRFEDLITFKDWIKLPKVVFILDGMDEIADIQDFVSELELFISKKNSLSIKYVISCRTNIYEKYLVKISGFQTFFLKNLNRYQINSILEKKHKLNLSEVNIHANHYDYLESPFFLDLFAKYYLQKSTLPNSDSEIWDLYVSETIKEHRDKQIKREVLNNQQLIIELKKVSIVNELMQRSYINDSELNLLVGDSYDYFTDNPFMVFNSELDNWSFKHRQIQEYFVAKSLSERSFEEVLKIIKIDGENSIHPSLFNSLTFLINLLNDESQTYLDLISWLQENQLEVLFKADSDRIDSSLRREVFRKYFNRECIDKTLWITTNRTFEVTEIAKFGDVEENIDYLLDIIESQHHFRVRISALDLLSNFTIPELRKKEIINFLLSLLKSPKLEIEIKSHVVDFIDSKKWTRNDTALLDEIIGIFRKETNKQLNRSLLSLLDGQEEIDKYYNYIYDEFLRDNKLKPRKDEDRVSRGNSYVLKNLILRINSTDNFLNIVKLFFNRELNLRYDNDFEQRLLDRCVHFSNQDDEFIISFLSEIVNEISYHIHENFIIQLIVRSEKQKEATSFFLKAIDFKKISFFLSKILDESTLEIVVEELLNKKLENKRIEVFRNYIGNLNSRELSVRFNDIMIEKGVEFEEKVFTSEDQEKRIQFFKEKVQDNIDILFEPNRLLIEVKKIFDANSNSIDRERIYEIESEWYKTFGHGSLIDSSISIIHNLNFHNDSPYKFEDFEEFISNDFILFREIKKKIERYNSSNWKFDISRYKSTIEKWCLKESNLIDFDNILQLHNTKSFSYKMDYEKLETVLFFQNLYDFKLSKDFLLNCLQYADLEKAEDEDSLMKLRKKIDDDDLFNKQIVENIKSKELFSFVLNKHIAYAIDNRLQDAYTEIIDFFVSDVSMYNTDRMLEKFAKIYSGIDLLKTFCDDVKSRICWSSLKILSEDNGHIDFCVQKALEYLKNDDERYNTNALELLFKFNQAVATDYLLDFLRNGIGFSVRHLSFSNYNVIDNYDKLEVLFDEFYNERFDQFESHSLRTFYNSYISNLSKTEVGYKNTLKVLERIKKKLREKKADLFYINLLMDDSKNSYINSKSNPYNFVNAKRVANNISII